MCPEPALSTSRLATIRGQDVLAWPCSLSLPPEIPLKRRQSNDSRISIPRNDMPSVPSVGATGLLMLAEQSALPAVRRSQPPTDFGTNVVVNQRPFLRHGTLTGAPMTSGGDLFRLRGMSAYACDVFRATCRRTLADGSVIHKADGDRSAGQAPAMPAVKCWGVQRFNAASIASR
jgi:hypothetical protein